MSCAQIIIDAVVAINGTVSRSYGVVSSVSTRPEGARSTDKLTAEGWTVHKPQGVPYRKAVMIELPADVHEGDYKVGGCTLNGLYADHAARDGMGATVYVLCNPQQGATSRDYNGAIDNTIAAGLSLSVPQADGTRAIIPVKVLATTALYDASHPGYNA